MKIAFIRADPKKKLSARLTLFWTGSATYHVGFTDGNFFWDQNLLRRVRRWPYYGSDTTIVLVDCPVDVSVGYLTDKLLDDENHYGWFDYMMFALRPIYHLFGKSTRNMGGVICSEMVANDLQANGWGVQFDEVPSPADLEKVLL